MPVEGRLRGELAQLYPEVGHDLAFTAPVLNVRYRRPIWIATPVLFLAVVAIAFLLTARGVLSWEAARRLTNKYSGLATLPADFVVGHHQP